MNKFANHQLTLGSLAAAIAFFAGIGPAQAVVVTPLNLQKPPLFLNAAVDPNIAVTVDDSGSMSNTYMPDSVVNNCAVRHPKFYYSGFNKIYYNPNIVYSPPLKPDGSLFPNASFTAAWFDGYEGQPTSTVTAAIGSQVANLGTRYYPNETMSARSNNVGNQTPFGYGLGTGSGAGATWIASNCTNPNTHAVNTGNDEFLPATDVVMTLAAIASATYDPALTGSAALGAGATGVGVTDGEIDDTERLTIDFIARGGLPAGVTNLNIDITDPSDGTDVFRIVYYAADRVTVLRTDNFPDLDADQAITGLRNVGKIDLFGGAGSNIVLRRIRFREEESAFLPITNSNGGTPTYTGYNNANGGAGFTSAAFYTSLRTGATDLNDPASYEVNPIAAGDQQNFANWFSYYRTRYLFSRTALTRVFAVQDDNLRIVWQNLNLDQLTPGTDVMTKFSDVAPLTGRTTFFQWLYKTATNGNTPTRESTIRVGNFFSYGNSTIANLTNPYYEGLPVSRELTCRQNFHVLVTDGFWNTTNDRNPTWAGTPENDTVAWTFPDPGAPAYTPTTQTESRIYWNELHQNSGCLDSGGGATECRPTMADISFYYWGKDLRTDLANNVPKFMRDTSGTDTEDFYKLENDPANWQHVVQYIVGLGVAGTLTYPTDLPALVSGARVWPAADNNSPPAVDDTWHAAINSRGEYFSAADPDELVNSLSAVLQNVLVRRGRSAAATVTSGIIQASTLAFRTEFDASDWSGQVFAYRINSSGLRIEPPIWDAGATLTARTSERSILTSSGPTGGGIPFRWANMPATYQALLNDNPATPIVDNDNRGSARVDYLRGTRSGEVNNGGPFRIRNTLLGAVVNSGAVVVAAPAAGYTDDTWPSGSNEETNPYSTFRETYKSRPRYVYVGANDGMLHAFDAGRAVDVDVDGNLVGVDQPGTGEERWAYVPYETASNLPALTNPNYQFTPYVDNSPVVRDIFVNGAWRTVLVGALRRGGQGIFALDITSPSVTEANASTVVMWEFSDDVPSAINSPSQLGYTYGKPNVARLANGKWVVVLPGSYNSDEATDANVGTGNSALFVLDAADGSILRQFNLTGSKGLTSPTMGDYDDDFIDEFAVAGDLNGQLWRFDLSNANPASWSVTKIFQPAVDGEQPITSAPRIFPDPATGGLIVVFGTGKYLEPIDRGNNIPTQALYGVRESGASTTTATIGQLVGRTFTPTTLPNGDRVFSINNPTALTTTDRGWYIPLAELGERDVTSAGAQFSLGLAIFSTIIPNGNDPCVPGLRGNVYILDAASGSASQVGALFGDINGDGQINATDASAVGRSVESTVSEGSPALLVNAGGGVGTLVDFPDIRVPQTVWRRRSWREIPNQ